LALANHAHSSRLRAFVAFFLDKTNFRTDGQLVEISIDDGVTVKVDLTTVRSFDEAAVFAGRELRNSTVAFPDVLLYLSAHMALHILDLTHRRVESLPDRELALGGIAARLVNYYVMMSGRRDSKINLEEIAMPMAGLRSRHHHMAARCPIAEPFEAFDLRLDFGSQFR